MKTRRSLSNDKNAVSEKIDEKNAEGGDVSTVKSLPIIRTLRSRTITSDTEDEVVRTPKSKKRNNKIKNETSSNVKDTAKESKHDDDEVLSPKSSKKRHSANRLFVITEIKEEIEPDETEIKLENEKTGLKSEEYEVDSSDAVSVDEKERKLKVRDEEKEGTEIKEEVQDFNVHESIKNENFEGNSWLVTAKSTEENIRHVNSGNKIENYTLSFSAEKTSSVSPKKLKRNLVDDRSSDAVYDKEIKIEEIESVNDSQILKRKPYVSPKALTTTVGPNKNSSCETPSSDSSIKKSSDSEEETINILRKGMPSKATYVSPRNTPVVLTKKQAENLEDDQSSNDGSSKNSIGNEVNKYESEDDDDSDDEMPEAISFESGKDQINQVLTMAAEAIRKQKQKKKEEMKKRIEMIRVQKAEKERKYKEKLKQLEANLPPRLNEDDVSRLRDTPEIPTIRDVEPQVKKRKKESFEKVPKKDELQPSKKNKINKFDDYIPLNNVEGSTKFGVVPLEVTLRIPKSSSESAAEFKRQALFGSRIGREPAKNQLIYNKKLTASGKHVWGNWGQFA